MTTDPKLVEALAREIVPLVACWNGEEDTHPDDCSDAAWIEAREMAAAFFNRYRLVQLPEQSNGEAGTVECHPCGEPEYQHFVGQVVPIPDPGTPVYILPGDPQEVDEKEYRARVYGEFPPEEAPDA